MAKSRTSYRCASCDAASARWTGRCGQCGAWNSLVEELPSIGPRLVERAAEVVLLASVPSSAGEPIPTGLDELDRAFSGGLVPGSVTLVGGEPGVGKSTLLLQVAAAVASRGRRALVVSAEESAEQVRRRADRLGEGATSVAVVATTSVEAAVEAAEAYEPDLLVVDSIQTVFDRSLGAVGGSVAQVRSCAGRLVELAKRRHLATLLVGHVTKDGSLAGPRALEHMVDTVCEFDGDRHHALRVLSVVKHRFGPAGELGVFVMGAGGLEGVADPSALLLGDRRANLPGSVVAPLLEGRRPLLVEIQALVAPTSFGTARRTAQGLSHQRLSVLLAVLDQRAGIPLGAMDVFVSAVGGIRVTEPASDLAVALALASAARQVAAPPGLVACGEVGLGGEIRQVVHTDRRLAEAARRGFTHALVPPSAPEPPAGMTCTRVATLVEAVEALGGTSSRRGRGSSITTMPS